MTSRNPRAFSFETAEHWQSCLLFGVDIAKQALQTWPGVVPSIRFMRPQALDMALALPCEHYLWREADGLLWRKSPNNETLKFVDGLHPMHKAEGVCASGSCVWVWANTEIAVFDQKSLAVLWRLPMPGPVRALAVAGNDESVAVFEQNGGQHLALMTSRGDVKSTIHLTVGRAVKGIVWARKDVVVLLTSEGDALLEFDLRTCDVVRRTSLSFLVECSDGLTISRSGEGPIILFSIHKQSEVKSCVFLDSNSVKLGATDLPKETTAVFPCKHLLSIAAGRKFVIYEFTAADKPSSIVTNAVIVTPPLAIPQRPEEEGWRRLEIEANLPVGTKLEVAVAQFVGDDELKSVKNAWPAAKVSSGTASDFLGVLDTEAIATFQGSKDSGRRLYSLRLPQSATATLVFKLILQSSINAASPGISSMKVVYGGKSLASRLPAVMLRDDAKTGHALTSIMGMLDAVSGDLDQAILSLDKKSDVQRADNDWLDEMAGWIGLPWHRRIPVVVKRMLLRAAPAILQTYGARSGLEQVLDAALQGLEVEYSITDFTADFDVAATTTGFATDSKLPMLLAGYATTAAVLGRKATVGDIKLQSQNQDAACGNYDSVVLITIAAVATVKQQLNVWLPHVLKQMVPAHVELRIRWVTPVSLPVEAEDFEKITVSGSKLDTPGRLISRQTHLPIPLSQKEFLP